MTSDCCCERPLGSEPDEGPHELAQGTGGAGPRAPVAVAVKAKKPLPALRERQDPVVVAVIGMRVVEPAVDQVVEVLPVGDRLVPAARPVGVSGLVPTGRRSGASVGVGICDLYDVLVDVVAVGMVEMAVVEVVQVAFVLDRGVAAACPVDVAVVRVRGVFVVAHGAEGRVWVPRPSLNRRRKSFSPLRA